MWRCERHYKLGRQGATARFGWQLKITTAKQKKSTFWQDRINSQRVNPWQLWMSLKTICEDERKKAETSFKANDFCQIFQGEGEEDPCIDSHCAPTAYYIQVIKWTASLHWNICKWVVLFNNRCTKQTVWAGSNPNLVVIGMCYWPRSDFDGHVQQVTLFWRGRSQLFTRSLILMWRTFQTIVQSQTCHSFPSFLKWSLTSDCRHTWMITNCFLVTSLRIGAFIPWKRHCYVFCRTWRQQWSRESSHF